MRISIGLTMGIITSLACASLEAPEPRETAKLQVAPVEKDLGLAAPPGTAPSPVPRSPTESLLPLAEGHQWTWEIIEHKRAGTRVFGKAVKKQTQTRLAYWTLTIGAFENDRYSATLIQSPAGDGLPLKAEMQLWRRDGQVWMDAGNGERLAIEASVPANPVSSERIRCVAHMLGGLVGNCAPVAGGPLGTHPGLHHAVVVEHIDKGAWIARTLISLATALLIIPANEDILQTATLVDFKVAEGQTNRFSATDDPLLAFFRSGTTRRNSGKRLTKAIKKYGGNPESVAAALTQVPPGDMRAVAAEILPLLASADRYPVTRVAIQQGKGRRLAGLAQLRPQLDAKIPQLQRESLLALFEDSDQRATADALIEGRSRFLLRVVAAANRSFDDDVLERLEKTLEQHPVYAADVLHIVRLFTFDAGKVEASKLMIDRLPESERAALVRESLQTLTFEPTMLELMTYYEDLLSALPRSEREAMVRTMRFRQDEARALLDL